MGRSRGAATGMRIWLFNPFDPLPSRDPLRYSYLVSFLVNHGYSATWWTSRFAHWSKSYLTKEQLATDNRALGPNGRIAPTWTSPYRNHVGIGRTLNHFIWAWTVYAAARRTREQPDVIFASSPPLLAARLLGRLATERRVPLILDVVDLWPEAFEIAVPAGARWLGRQVLRPLMALETRNFRDADAITAVSETYRLNALARSGQKPSMLVPYGIDLRTWPGRRQRGWSAERGKIRVCYAGTLGPHHDVETVVRAAKLLESDPRIEVILAGDGPLREKLRALAASLEVLNLTFTGWMHVNRVRELLTTCDIGIIAVTKGSVISIPLKTFDYLAAGCAIVHSLKGELDDLVRHEGVGIRYVAGDASSLAQSITELARNVGTIAAMGERGQRLVERVFDRELIHSRLTEFITSVAEGPRRGGAFGSLPASIS